MNSFFLQFFCLRGKFPLYPEFATLLHNDPAVQRIRIIVGDARIEPGTFGPEVWCAANEPPHLHTKEPPHLQNEPPHLRINSVPQTDATTFAFASVSFLPSTTILSIVINFVNAYIFENNKLCILLKTYKGTKTSQG